MSIKIREPQNDFPLERYRLTLRHDMLVGSDTVEIDPPFIVDYCMPRGRLDSGPCVVNWMLDRMRCEVLNKRGNEEAKP